MSVIGGILKGGTIIGLCFGVGLAIQFQNNTHHQLAMTKSDLSQIKMEYQSELHRQPSVKTVTTDYQAAINAGKQFLKLQNQLHDQENTESKRGQAITKQINAMVGTPGQLNSPLVVNQLKGWHGKLSYGGEDASGNVALAYRFYNQKGQLMDLTVFSYSSQTQKLNQFISFPTYAGQRALQESLKG